MDLATLGLEVKSTGVAAAKKDLDAFTTSAGGAEKAAKAVEQASGKMDRSTRQTAAALKEVKREADAAKFSLDPFAKALKLVIDEEMALEREARKLKAAIDPAWGALDKMNQELAKSDRLLSRGKISAELHAKSIAAARSEYEKLAKVQAGGLSGFQKKQVLLQAPDIIQGVLGGQPLQQVALQQGGQIAQILQMGEGGIGGGLKGILGMINPVTAGLAGLFAIFGVGTAAAFKYADAQDKLSLSLMGLGGTSGQTAAQLQAMAEAGANAADISVASAREQEQAYLGMGVTNGLVIERLIADSRNYALVSGKSLKEAQTALGGAMADTTGAGLELLRALGMLDAKTKAYIESLERQGEHEAAQEVLLGKVSVAVQGATQHVNGLASAWNAVSNFASNAFDAMGKEFSRPFRNDPQSVIDNYLHMNSGMSQGNGIFGGIGRDKYLQAIDDQKKLEQQAADRKKQGALNNISLAGASAANVLDPTGSRRKELDDYMKAAKTAHDAKQLTDEKYARAEAGYKRQLASLYKTENPKAPKVAKTSEEREIDRAIDQSKKAAIALGVQNVAQEKLNQQVAAGTITSAQANREAAITEKVSQYQKAMDQASGAEKVRLTENVRRLSAAMKEQQSLETMRDVLASTEQQGKRNDLLELEGALIGKNNRERAVAIAQYQALQDLMAKGIDLVGNKDLNTGNALSYAQRQAAKANVGASAGGANADADNEAAKYFDDARKAAEAYRRDVDIVAQTMYMSREAAAQYRKEQELINEATLRYGTLSEQQIADIRAVAESYGQTEGIKRLQDATEEWRGSIKGAFMDFASGTQSLSAGITQIIVKLAEMAASKAFDKIWNGGLGKESSSVLSYFGFGSSGSSDTASTSSSLPSSYSYLDDMASFDGGGWTGNGPRSGGMDGKGGRLAMLHPNETVTDHTKGQSAPGSIIAPIVQIPLDGAGMLAPLFQHINEQMARARDNAIKSSDKNLRKSLSAYQGQLGKNFKL